MKSLLAQNRELLRGFLDSRDDLDCFWPEYGTIVFPRLRSGKTDPFYELLRIRFDTSVVPGSFFDCPEHFRIGVGAPTEMVAEALEQLGKGLDHFAAVSAEKTAAGGS
jgi:aspartate/methionine/tyrosine aminotransferase